MVKRAITLVLLAALLSGCGPTQRERRVAWMRAFQSDLDAVHDRWKDDVARGRFQKSADAMRELEARYQAVYTVWAMRIDPLSQAVLSYAVALGSRADRGEMTHEEANRLFEKMNGDVTLERRRLALPAQETQARRDAVMLEAWTALWSGHREAFQGTPDHPIDCRITPDSEQGSLVRCE